MSASKTNDARFGQVLINGHGRSGTNWLKDILDCSHATHCRNEPDMLGESPFDVLPPKRLVHTDQAALEAGWERAVAWASERVGERDRFIQSPKDHLRPFARSTGLYYAVARPRRRKVLSQLLPSLRGSHWIMPSWIFDARKLERALPVLKINQAPGWSSWALANRPRVAILHIVRHPGGMLNSWKNRYVAERDPDDVLRSNHDRLATIAESHEEWAGRFGDIEALGVEEAELWFWRYAVEEIHRAGSDKPGYMLIKYEDLAQDTVGLAERIYAHLGLEWTDAASSRIHAEAVNAPSISAAWRSKLDDHDVAAIERVLAGSEMERWWPA
jgi:hypothetical protein